MATVLETLSLVEQMSGVHTAISKPVFDELGITRTEGALLWALHHAQRDLTMSEAAVALDCDASNITHLARGLERATLAERVADPADRRTRRLHITNAGHESIARVVTALEEQSPLRALDEQQRAQLAALLTAAAHHSGGPPLPSAAPSH